MGRNCGHGGDHGAIFSTNKSKRKANGCMAAFYHLFDFQHAYFPSHHGLTIDSPSRSKGFKLVEKSPTSTTYKDKPSLNIPVSLRVRTETGTRSSRLIVTDTSTISSSEMCNSPGSKTPSLVARLMGLDLLPEKTDLNKSLSSLHTMTHHGTSRLTSHRLSKKRTHMGGGTRSLPESPRVSSSRRSDFDIHRLSLQLNKEHKREEFSCSRLKLMKQQDLEDVQSPRQILKQIVTRRAVGMDITNSVKNREVRPLQDSNEIRRDTTVSCSPRTRFSNKKNKPNTSSSFRPEQTTHKPKPKTTEVILVSTSKPSGEKQSKNRVKQKELRPINQYRKAKSDARFTQRLLSESTTDAKASNPLHIKKFKKVPKSSDVADNTKPPQKQVKHVSFPHISKIEGIKSNETEENGPQVARNHHGSELIGELCSVVASNSSKRCPILREIASVEFCHRILETKKLGEEEGEEIIAEIERDIIEALVRETAYELILQTTPDRKLIHH